MDRDHRWHRTAPREGEERRPEEVDVAPRQPSWQGELLPEHPERRGGGFDLDPRRPKLGLAVRRAMGEPEEAELAASRQLEEQRARVDPDTGGRRNQGAQVDGEEWGAGQVRIGEGGATPAKVYDTGVAPKPGC